MLSHGLKRLWAAQVSLPLSAGVRRDKDFQDRSPCPEFLKSSEVESTKEIGAGRRLSLEQRFHEGSNGLFMASGTGALQDIALSFRKSLIVKKTLKHRKYIIISRRKVTALLLLGRRAFRFWRRETWVCNLGWCLEWGYLSIVLGLLFGALFVSNSLGVEAAKHHLEKADKTRDYHEEKG